MAKKKNGYIVTSSNYTLKEFHKDSPRGNVYERDFMTTSNLSGWDNGVFPISADGFKMVYRLPIIGTRAHNFGKYLKYVNEDGEYEEWMLSRGAEKTSSTTEGEIKLKNDDTTLLTYSYYGSCTELIQSTIRHIIDNFPAEAYSKETESPVISGESTVFDCIYELNNPFGIDFMTEKIIDKGSINELRYFALSYQRYTMYINGLGCGCAAWFSVSRNPDFCSSKIDGSWDKIIEIGTGKDKSEGQTAKIIRYFFNGEPYYLTDTPNLELKLTPSDIETYFESLDDFEKVLLNRKSVPIYTATLDFPHETQRGIETYKKKFTWPRDEGGWNLDISSVMYERYVKSLLELSEFYDGYRTDNLWRMMTHDSVKNMDLTFNRQGTDEDKEDYNEGTTRMRGLLLAYGRLFDDLKRYIDNIRVTNTITYNGQGNLPDYFLTDTLGLSGWEVSNALNGLDLNAVWKDESSEENPREYTISDANVRFMNNLKLNSRAILSRKGTRYGIEMILGLFGFKNEEDYTINEFVSTARIKEIDDIVTHAPETGDIELSVEEINHHKNSMAGDSADGYASTTNGLLTSVFYYDVYKYTEIENIPTDGFVCVVCGYKSADSSNPCPECGSNEWAPDIPEVDEIPDFAKSTDPIYVRLSKSQKIYKKIKETWKTSIPWNDYSDNLDGGAYFQMYGGWKEINGENYRETLNYLKVVRTLDELTLIPEKSIITNEFGDVCYVAEIDEEEFENYFPGYEFTHYFKLENPENVQNFEGEYDSGWKPVSESEMPYVNYLESIIDEYRGNNPHVGFGNYDNGEGYFEYIKQIFKGAIEENQFGDEMYECDTGELISSVTEQGFAVEDKIVDNKKCWFFYDKDRYDVQDQNLQELSLQMDGYNYDGAPMNFVKGPEGVYDVRGDYGGVDGEKINGEATIYEEPSVINRKNLEINFKLIPKFKEDEAKYIENTVMPYLEQVVPSTTILQINIGEKI